MSGRTHEASRAVRLSAEVYRRLLLVFPATFRRQYGAHMAQVFRDCCREAAHADGTVGLWHYWLIALGDLVVSAFAERRREEFSMSRATWIRLGSLAAIVGGVTAALFAALELVIATLQLVDEKSPLGLALFPVQVVASKATPALLLLYVLALVGLQARGAGRAGVFGWIAVTIAVLGQVIIGLGDILQAVVTFPQADGCRTPLNCNFYDPNNYLLMGYMLALLGSLIFVVGMILYGIAALRRRILSQHNELPLILGLLALLSDAAGFIATLVSTGTDYAGTQRWKFYSLLWPSFPPLPGYCWGWPCGRVEMKRRLYRLPPSSWMIRCLHSRVSDRRCCARRPRLPSPSHGEG